MKVFSVLQVAVWQTDQPRTGTCLCSKVIREKLAESACPDLLLMCATAHACPEPWDMKILELFRRLLIGLTVGVSNPIGVMQRDLEEDLCVPCVLVVLLICFVDYRIYLLYL